MKLWPFSKKPGNPATESHFELPPGVMLASPDEASPEVQTPTAPGRYDAMHGDEPAPEASATTNPMPEPLAQAPEAKPDLPQFVEQNQLEFISQQAAAAPAELMQAAATQTPPLPEVQAAPSDAPIPTKAELYQEINDSLTSLYDPADSVPEPPSQTTALPEPEPEMLSDEALEALLSKPVPSPQAPEPPAVTASLIDFGLPPKKEAAPATEPIFGIGGSFEPNEADIDLDAILYGPAAPDNKPEPSQANIANLDFLAPPSVQKEPVASTEALYTPPVAAPQGLEETFSLPASLPGIDDLPGEFSAPLCDLSADLAAPPPLADGFAADELQQMADFLGADFLPQTEPIPSFSEPYSAPEAYSAATEAVFASIPDPLEALLEEAASQPEAETTAAFGLSAPIENMTDYHATTPENDFTLPAPDAQTAAETATETADDGLFSLSNLGGFDEFAVPDNLFQATESFAPAFTEEPLAKPMSGQPEATTYQPEAYEPQATEALYQTEALDYEADDTPDETDYEPVACDFESYDMGHYDDPEQPAEAFVLSDDTSAYEPAAPQQTQAHYSEPAADLQAMAQFLGAAIYETRSQEDDAPQPESSYNEEAVKPIEYQPEETTAAEEDSHSIYVETPEAAPKPMAAYQHPIPKIQPAAQQPSQPELPTEQAKAAKEAVKPQKAPKPVHPYAPQPRRLYHDSVTEALQGFQEEMLLEDNRFLRNSINNLVDNYFANQES